jgi:hypothetical protein
MALAHYKIFLKLRVRNAVIGMSEIEKVGDLESRNLSIENHLRNTGIEKSHIGLVKISLFRMKKFEINELIQYETFFQ